MTPDIRLDWRSVLAPEDSRFTYAEWVRDLSDQSGVYLIRSDYEQFDDELLYIGESHTHSQPSSKRSYRGLYRTLTRHFNTSGWKEGLTYHADDVLVAVVITNPDIALVYQNALIARYQPRDNELALQLRMERYAYSS